MKPEIHPLYREVLFHDTTADAYFVAGSTTTTERTVQLEGEAIPCVPLDVSSASQVYYNGKQKNFAKESSAARFNQRLNRFPDAMKIRTI
ncbi:50S ribosomal protein L31 type B [Erwinia amylovora MR1]|nr:50S ribosomal protein L31 type B [Erwinia amylovora MR1]